MIASLLLMLVAAPVAANRRTFNLFGVLQFEDTEGFAEKPKSSKIDGIQDVISYCKSEFLKSAIPFSTYNNRSTMIYYQDESSYRSFRGVDLLPSNRRFYTNNSPYSKRLNFEDSESKEKDRVIQSCEYKHIEDTTVGTWSVQRIGPFTSYGGQDIWQVGVPDLGKLSEILHTNGGEIDILNYQFTPVLYDGTPLGFPPISIKFMSAQPTPGIKARFADRQVFCSSKTGFEIPSLDKLYSNNCYNLTSLLTRHNDDLCIDKIDSLSCLLKGNAIDQPRRLQQSIDLEAILSDIRPSNSPKIEWYLQLAIQWKPVDLTIQPLSQIFIAGPGEVNSTASVRVTSDLYRYPVHTKEESVYLYSSKMLRSGQLVHVEAHSIGVMTEVMLLLRGRYEDFGLNRRSFNPSEFPSHPITAEEAGFASNEELGHYLFHKMKDSQVSYDQQCSSLSNCARPRPEVICAVVYQNNEYIHSDGRSIAFDRRPLSSCRPWNFSTGEEFVVIAFNRRLDRPLFFSNDNKIPRIVHQYSTFTLSYLDSDSKRESYFITQLCSHWGNFFTSNRKLSPTDVAALRTSILLWKGPPNHQYTLFLLKYIFFVVYFLLWVISIYLLFKIGKKIKQKIEEFEAYEDDEDEKVFQPLISSEVDEDIENSML